MPFLYPVCMQCHLLRCGHFALSLARHRGVVCPADGCQGLLLSSYRPVFVVAADFPCSHLIMVDVRSVREEAIVRLMRRCCCAGEVVVVRSSGPSRVARVVSAVLAGSVGRRPRRGDFGGETLSSSSCGSGVSPWRSGTTLPCESILIMNPYRSSLCRC